MSLRLSARASVIAIAAVLVLAPMVTRRADGRTAISIEAPSSLERAAERLRAVDLARLTDDLAAAGLPMPADISVTLVADDDSRAASLPPWIVGFAVGSTQIVIFPERILAYPYESLESVLRHEIAHLALSARAAVRPLPRWFHEGVAVSVDAGWDVSSRLQLLLAMRRDPGLASVGRLFAGTQPDSALAYRLSAALVADLRRRHGGAVPGAIAARVAAGTDFARAFELETGDTPDAAAARAWAGYRRWTVWVSALTSDAMPWAIILALAFVAFAVRARQRKRRKHRWDEEDGYLSAGPGD